MGADDERDEAGAWARPRLRGRAAGGGDGGCPAGRGRPAAPGRVAVDPGYLRGAGRGVCVLGQYPLYPTRAKVCGRMISKQLRVSTVRHPSTIVVLLVPVLLGCGLESPPTYTPAPTSTLGPLLSEAEAIATVKQWLARIPTGSSLRNCLALVTYYGSQGNWTAEHTPPTQWIVHLKGGLGGSWRLYESNMIVTCEGEDASAWAKMAGC